MNLARSWRRPQCHRMWHESLHGSSSPEPSCNGSPGANAEYQASGHISKSALQVDPPITGQVTQRDSLPGWHNNKWERWEAKPDVRDPKSSTLVTLLELLEITALTGGPRGSREGQRLPCLLLCRSCHVPSLFRFLICKMGIIIASTSWVCCQE